MDPGDALFFHGNTLHSSSAYKWDKRRWALLYCYNKVSNNPFIQTHQPFYSKLTIADENVIELNGIEFADGSEDFQSQYTKPKKD